MDPRPVELPRPALASQPPPRIHARASPSPLRVAMVDSVAMAPDPPPDRSVHPPPRSGI